MFHLPCHTEVVKSLPVHHWVSFCVWLPVGLNIIKRTKQRPSNKLTGSFHCIRAVWQWVGLKHHFSCALAKRPFHMPHYSSWAYSYTDTLLAVQESPLWSHYLPACTPLYLNKLDWLKSSFASSLQSQNKGVTSLMSLFLKSSLYHWVDFFQWEMNIVLHTLSKTYKDISTTCTMKTQRLYLSCHPLSAASLCCRTNWVLRM